MKNEMEMESEMGCVWPKKTPREVCGERTAQANSSGCGARKPPENLVEEEKGEKKEPWHTHKTAPKPDGKKGKKAVCHVDLNKAGWRARSCGRRSLYSLEFLGSVLMYCLVNAGMSLAMVLRGCHVRASGDSGG